VNDPADEQWVLRCSIWLTVCVAGSGVLFSLLSGSLSIIFDGVFSALDAALSGLALHVVRLLARGENRRFQYGYWHIEPLVLVLNGGILMLLCFYAFINAAGSLLGGGKVLAFDWAIVYAVLVCMACFGMFFYERRVNRRIKSEFLTLDTQGWLMAGLITSALLVAFCAAWLMEGTRLSPLTPYADPAVLSVLTVCLVGVPVRTVRKALREVFLITPSDLDRKVRAVMDAVVARHGFKAYTSYVLKTGRARFIEIHVVVPPGFARDSVAAFDAVRSEISEAIGGEGRERWLTVAFTANEQWI
jgi:predicted Co/Zn/Cd cation transporter (cation efflux family)